MANRWELVPATDFTERSHWTSLGGNRFAAMRLRLLVIPSESPPSRSGPVVEEHKVAQGDRITLRVKRQRVVTRTATISETIRSAVRQRVLEALSTQVSTELSAKVPGLAGKVKLQNQANAEEEITTEFEQSLTNTVSHSVEETEGREFEIELSGASGPRTAQLRRRYGAHHWDIYLHSYDYLELAYRRSWHWSRVRKTIKRVDAQRVGWPLGSITFYVPQPDFIVTYGVEPEELTTPDAFEVARLGTPMTPTRPPPLQDLEAAAQLAFPVTRAEKAAAAKRKKPRPTAMGFARGPSKHKAAKKAKGKATTRKAARKNVTRRVSTNKAVRKQVARPRVAKRKVAKHR